MKQDRILVLDLGSEENPRLAREIRALGVYSEIYPHDLSKEQLEAMPGVKGIILNGGPNRVVDGVEIDTSADYVTVSGRTWHGLLASRLVVPDAGQLHYTVSGDLNAVLGELVQRLGLWERMAAEEGFVYACATGQQECGIVFGISDEAVTMDFSLGEDLGAADADESLELVEALLAAICDESSISEDGRTLSLTKRTGGAHDE